MAAARKICAYVTGGASGLGRATVERLAKRGANVIIADLPQSNGQQVADDLGPNVLFHPTNVSKGGVPIPDRVPIPDTPF